MVCVCSTFAFATETTLEQLKNCENIAKSTGFWLSVWKNWCVEKKITDEIEYQLASHNSIKKKNYKVGKKLLIQKKGKEKKRAIEKDQNRFANKVKILACAHA